MVLSVGDLAEPQLLPIVEEYIAFARVHGPI